MLEVDVQKIIPVTRARAIIASVVDDVMRGNLYVLTRNGKPAVLMVPVEMMGRLKNQLGKSKSTGKEAVVATVKETQEHENIKTLKQKDPEKEETKEQENIKTLKQKNMETEKLKNREIEDKSLNSDSIEKSQLSDEKPGGSKVDLDEVDKAIEEYENQKNNNTQTAL